MGQIFHNNLISGIIIFLVDNNLATTLFTSFTTFSTLDLDPFQVSNLISFLILKVIEL